MGGPEHSQLFEGVDFQAPEGVVTARVKGSSSEGDLADLLLWFYDRAGTPLDVNLTVTLSLTKLAGDGNGDYNREVIAKVQEWLAGIRDGEPLRFLG